MNLTPKAITAALVGVKSPLQTFALQRAINEYPEEPMLAILPGVALQELWGIVGIAETALLAVSAMVVVTALIGMMATIFSSLNERRREMAIFRAMGASPIAIVGLLVLEAILTAAAGGLLGLALLYAGLAVAQPVIDSAFGLFLPINPPAMREFLVLLAVVAAGAIASLVPALRAYRISLADGMLVRT
jgi:putative ABC transport system permease protein